MWTGSIIIINLSHYKALKPNMTKHTLFIPVLGNYLFKSRMVRDGYQYCGYRQSRNSSRSCWIVGRIRMQEKEGMNKYINSTQNEVKD